MAATTLIEDLESIINKIERLYAESAVLYQEFTELIGDIRTDMYWAYKEAKRVVD